MPTRIMSSSGTVTPHWLLLLPLASPLEVRSPGRASDPSTARPAPAVGSTSTRHGRWRMVGAPWSRGADPGRRLEGKRAFVTGAGTAPGGELLGIGEAIAVLYAAQGAKVAVADVSAERAEATLALIAEAGGEAVATVGDLSDEADSARCVAEAADAFGGLDTVVNCAAVSPRSGARPAELDLAEWHGVMRVNLDASLLTVRSAVPHLLADRKSVV